MEELFKIVQKYKDGTDGPFFCIMAGAHVTASLSKNVSVGSMLPKLPRRNLGRPGR